MSSELWQQAKEALAEAMTLDDDQRAAYLTELKSNAPEVHDEVVSLISSQVEAEQQGFLSDADDTMDQYRTETYDPNKTRHHITTDDLQEAPRAKGLPKDLVGNDYELEKKIGQGGMGVVYKAYHRSLRRTVALKIITGGGLRDEIDIARFHIEAEAAARLDHPGIIPVYDVGEHNGNHYYAMSYIEGPSLSAYVGKQAKLLRPRRAAELMEQVCLAVQYAHDRAVIHRDLKPANIMLENDDIPRLADFGLAKNMSEDDGLTMTGQVMGTPSYMAPEQATGKLDQISNRTDVYSLGATLYALLAGRPPFAGGTMLETIRQVVRSEPEPLTQIIRAIPVDLQTICEKCLAKKPQDRYASAEDVASDLRRFLDGFPISARPLGMWSRSVRWCQRNPLEGALLATTAAALIVGTIVSVRFGLEARQELERANKNAQNVRAAIEGAYLFASENVLAQEPGMQAAREELLKSAQLYYTELVKQNPHDAASQLELADSQFMLSKVLMAMGKDAEARTALTAALTAQQQLVAADAQDVAALTALAKTHNQLQRLSKKQWQALTQLSFQGQPTAAQVAAAEQHLSQWQQHATEVVQLRNRVIALQPGDLESQRLLAEATMNQGVAIGQKGYAEKDLSEQDRSREVMLRAQDIRTATLENHEEAYSIRRDMARCYWNMANTEFGAAEQEMEDNAYQQRLRRASTDLADAIAAYQLLPAAELTLDVRFELANSYRLRADAYFRLLELKAAAADYQQAEELLQRLVERNPNVYRYRNLLAETQFNLSNFWFYDQQDERALIQLKNCRATLLQSLRMDPNNLDPAHQVVRFTKNMIEALLENKKFDQAEELLADATQELLALQKESEEYAALSTSIDALQSMANQVQQQRTAAETPDDVT
ncbi:MAG: protein kinase domain-containing protein [Bythopirellula sp.]